MYNLRFHHTYTCIYMLYLTNRDGDLLVKSAETAYREFFLKNKLRMFIYIFKGCNVKALTIIGWMPRIFFQGGMKREGERVREREREKERGRERERDIQTDRRGGRYW